MTAGIAIPKPYMRPQLHTAPLWPQINASKDLFGIITIFG
ncbi:NADH dehydrogenase subunit I [Iris pallida]|uniref:NADH dehydrogenase subunit I (Chloroplast) n=1 Tax=Iris pallida TaxID=29817 RepID=A0AAX6G3I8_IRIPA|nr:NADH dehydrogenase subunit I [Iris pallida]KAJ6832040.1 NADH dehydrogenase subunit I [Iris pallida]